MIKYKYKISSYAELETVDFTYSDYSNIVNSLKDFDILLIHYPFFNKYNILKPLIYWFKKQILGITNTSFYYEHSAIVIFEKDENGKNECYVYEATQYVKKTKLKYWLEKNRSMAISVFRYNHNDRTNDEKIRDYVKSAIYSSIGKRYSDIRYFIYSTMEFITGYWVGSRNSCAFHSAEFVAYVYYLLTNQKIFKEFFGFNAKYLHKTIKYRTNWFKNVGNYYIDNRTIFQKNAQQFQNSDTLNLERYKIKNNEINLINLHQIKNK